MPVFKIVEMRENAKGEKFEVISIVEGKNKRMLKKQLDNERAHTIKDKNYKIMEIKQ